MNTIAMDQEGINFWTVSGAKTANNGDRLFICLEVFFFFPMLWRSDKLSHLPTELCWSTSGQTGAIQHQNLNIPRSGEAGHNTSTSKGCGGGAVVYMRKTGTVYA